MKVNISLLQTDIEAGNYEKEFYKILSMLESLEILENHYVVLPELWLTGYAFSIMKEAHDFFQKNLSKFQDILKNKSLNLIGSVPWVEHGNVTNRSLVFSDKGDIKNFYDKIHLFKPLEENKYFCRGSRIVTERLTGFVFGVMLCYDIRFPELAKALMLRGANVIFVSAEWPETRIEQWILLNRARALENQIFIIACNRAGKSFGINFGGNSLIVDPKGELICQMGSKEESKSYEIELSDIYEAKKLFNVKNDTILHIN
jgi:predicted amidohydrolase